MRHHMNAIGKSSLHAPEIIIAMDLDMTVISQAEIAARRNTTV